jgi:putative transposase
MRHRIYAHLVWATRGRARLIDLRAARFLDRFLRDVARQERALVLEVGFVQTHVHLLIRQHPLTIVPRLLQRLKGGSAIVGEKERRTSVPLRWARGYTIESVSRHSLNNARAYVRDQAKRHPLEVIPGWVVPQPITAAREEEWIGEDRKFMGRRPSS